MKPSQDAAAADAKESTTIRFEWTLRGLKNLFENRLVSLINGRILLPSIINSALSKGEAKSKVTKSPKFGDGRWQVCTLSTS